ncbi:MAG: aminotransferase class III-fold pyridoxal phosphate-dependent enzyme [Chitinophagales bacterium]|nr:aminotransferase class III-fold pyridoxal phosphate-dependent enzyme [Chitinophagales bacterium]MCZ2392806.1 aminotransferase class III-fold pyridoxal phosphate-dependent enzyme [Chitinophagales bacterium]
MQSERQLFLQHIAQTSDSPLLLEIESASGLWLYGKNEEKWMDLIAGISVSNLGHCHPEIVKAVQLQAQNYMHTLVYGELLMSPQVKLAQLLASILPSTLQQVYYTNSGAEAVEGAMKLAKRYTGRPEIIGFHHAYHGSTQGALSLLGDEYWRNKFRPLLPGVRHLRYNHIDDLELINSQTAAVFIDPVQAESGVTVPSNDFMQALRKKCSQTGTLLVLDEIQTGMGRTGTMFAFEQLEIVPDILLLAKSFGGGMPLGAFISSSEIMSSLSFNPILGHITTFGGHPVSCAAALANLQVLLREKYIQEVKTKGNLFVRKLIHPAIQKITHKGLMIAVHLDNFENLQKVIQSCIQKGLLTDWFLFESRAMRIAPPLIITESEIEYACDIIISALDEVYK